jgi:hypothetical protein
MIDHIFSKRILNKQIDYSLNFTKMAFGKNGKLTYSVQNNDRGSMFS